MNIGERLELVASLVPACDCAADIGTDHAYVPVRLVERGTCSRVIASDIVAGPCRAAAETVMLHGLMDKIEVRQAPGLQGIVPGEAQAAVIAGMGGATIAEILGEVPETAQSIGTFVLQPMNAAALLRRWLAGHGYRIGAEALCRDAGRLYVVLRAVYEGTPYLLTDLEAEVGPCLLKERPELFRDQVEELLQSARTLLERMGRSEAARQTKKYRYWQRMESELEALLQ